MLREAEEEDFLKKICSISKQLIQELKHENIKKVMLYIIEAIEKGHGNIPSCEIAEALHLSSVTVRQSKSRGFRRLREKAVEKGFCSKDFDLGQFE